MFFVPKLKRKRGSNKKCLVQPFPRPKSGQQYEGFFTGLSVNVIEKQHIIDLYENGFYGKGSCSRSAPKVVLEKSISKETQQSKPHIEETLCLGLEEAAFLGYYLKVLKIYDMDRQHMEFEGFLKEALEVDKQFRESLAAYLYLKSKGWVIKSGLKFGGNFLIYHKGPRFYHASFVVILSTPSETEHLESKNLKGLQRVAETSDKDVLLLEIHTPDNFELKRPEEISKIEISELIVRRFNCTSFVQNQNARR